MTLYQRTYIVAKPNILYTAMLIRLSNVLITVLLARIHGTADARHLTFKSGVDLIKKRVFHIDNLDANTTVDNVSNFLNDAGVCVLSCYAVKSWLSKRQNASVTSMRVCVPACDSGKMLKSSLWPKSVIVRDWKFIKPTNKSGQ